MSEINIFENRLVPKHDILNDEQKAELLNDLNVAIKQLPRIKITDPIVKILECSKGDIIKITRDEEGIHFYYRVVV